jgi:hypothetical protein
MHHKFNDKIKSAAYDEHAADAMRGMVVKRTGCGY